MAKRARRAAAFPARRQAGQLPSLLASLFPSLLASLLAALVLAAVPARAAEDCFLVTDLDTGRVLAKQGLCAARHSPCSTFKIALGLMGFDSGILKSARSPVFTPQEAPDPAVARWREGWDRPQTPESWMHDSVVWYSQVLTTKLGAEAFQRYVHAMGYGNENLAGTPGKNDGLTRAWLSSSLAISPREQVDFLRRMLKGELPVSAAAVDHTVALLVQAEQPAGWQLFGKTGAGYLPGPDGTSDRDRPIGWFVGWARKDGRTAVFARFMARDVASEEPLGFLARRQTVVALGTVLEAQGR